MKKIKISSQEEYNRLSAEEIATSLLVIRKGHIDISGNANATISNNASAKVFGNARVTISGNANATISDNANANVFGDANVTISGNATATISDNANANVFGIARVILSGNARARISGDANAMLYDYSSAIVFGNARVRLDGNSTANLYGNSTASIFESASATLYNNASAILYGSARAILCGNARAVLYGETKATLYWYSAAWKLSPTAVIEKISDKATIIETTEHWTAEEWCEKYGIPIKNGKCIIYKKVSKDYETQEDGENKTPWKIGTTLEHPNWNPGEDECGEGKFHGCAQPFFTENFRNEIDDRYIAIEVAVSDMFAWKDPSYPYKIAFRKGRVLYTCDRFGTEIKTSDEEEK